MARHPSETSLALLAGGELGGWSRWRVQRHVAGCGECQREVSEFSALRQEVAWAGQEPEVDWNRLASEMKANIRLGLEAGECVGGAARPQSIFSLRALAACASLAVLVAASYLVERPAPPVAEAQAREATVLEASDMGIQVKEGQHAMMLLNTNARKLKTGASDVSYAATGSTVRARYVDSDTGYVTINNVYVQ